MREVTLLGQNVNSYGRDLRPSRTSFAELLERIDAIDGIERIRYTSPHPKDMREDVILAHARLASVCEHIHLPLQSGSSRILKAMRRTYTRERYLDRVALIREHVPDAAITTDIIVGFPGETEADFAQTLEVCEAVGYDGAFTFVFSPRRGTEAGALTDGLVAHEEKVERMQRLVEVVQRRATRARAALRRAFPRRPGGGHVAHRPLAAARALASQQGRELQRPGGAGRDRAGADHGRDEPDADRRALAAGRRLRRPLSFPPARRAPCATSRA